ncbi:MAG: rubrerythrin family protein [Prevotellaceae bacterium]|jgi:rubrerythrin|nr:rubrerythrin family protein [Prevotellaceae bacterium]
MATLKGSQTEKNILTAFAGESQARNRYDFFAGQATKDGFRVIADIFTETAEQEKQHAKRLFKLLEGGTAEILWSYPAGIIGTTLENLKEAAAGEHEEYAEMYPSFAKVAQEEGFKDIAPIFLNIASAETYHERRYLTLIERLEENSLFKRPDTVVWKCKNCGFHLMGKDAPAKCPACDHPTGHFIEVVNAKKIEDDIF